VPHAEDRPLPALPPLVDPAEVAGLAVEVALLRSVIRRLSANGGIPNPMLKGLAELRHQVEALCTALKTERALAGREEDAVAATLAQVLEELGDELELPR
jgi:hypothetical protein